MPAIESEAVRLLALVRRRPWRAVVAAEARRDPERFGAITAPEGAAALSLLPQRDAARALVVGDVWGRLAVPLSRRATVIGLLPSAPLAALLACVASQEDAPIAACAGTLAAPPFADGGFDLVLLHDGIDDAPETLPAAAALLAAAGVCYATARNRLAAGAFAASTPARSLSGLRARIADAGLVPLHEYACFPDAARPRAIVPLPLLAAHLRRQTNGLADLARTGIAEHLAPAFAFVLRRAR